MLGSAQRAGGSSGDHHYHHLVALNNPFPVFFQQQQQQQQQQIQACFNSSNNIVVKGWEEDAAVVSSSSVEPTSVLDLWSPSPSSKGGSGLSCGGNNNNNNNKLGHGGSSPSSYDDNNSNNSCEGGAASGEVVKKPTSGSSSSSRLGAFGWSGSNVDQQQQIGGGEQQAAGGAAIASGNWIVENAGKWQQQQQQQQCFGGRRDRSLDEWLADLQQQQQQLVLLEQQQGASSSTSNNNTQQQQQQQAAAVQYGMEELESMLLKCPSPQPMLNNNNQQQQLAKWLLSDHEQQQLLPAKEECISLDDSWNSSFQQQQPHKQHEEQECIAPLAGGGAARSFMTIPSLAGDSLYNAAPAALPAFGAMRHLQQSPFGHSPQQLLPAKAPMTMLGDAIGGGLEQFYALPSLAEPLQQGAGMLRAPQQNAQFGHLLQQGRILGLDQQHRVLGGIGDNWVGLDHRKRRSPPIQQLDPLLDMKFHHQAAGEDPILMNNNTGSWSQLGNHRNLMNQSQQHLSSSSSSGLMNPFGNCTSVNLLNNKEQAFAVPLVAHEEASRSSKQPLFFQQQLLQQQQEIGIPRKLQRVHSNPLIEQQQQQQLMGSLFSSLPPPPPPSSATTTTTIAPPAASVAAASATTTSTTVPDEGLGLMDQLLQLAQAIDVGNTQVAQSILARLNQHLFCHQGKRIQRLAFYFKEALAARLNSSILHHHSDHQDDEESGKEEHEDGDQVEESPLEFFHKVRAYTSFCEVSPLLRFAYLTANQAILEAIQGEQSVHIVDFDPRFGSQWSCLLQDLASAHRSGSSASGVCPQLRFTLVGPHHGQLQFVVESLSEFAKSLHMVPAPQFHVVVCGAAGDMTPSMLRLADGEAVVVNFTFSLHRALAVPDGVAAAAAAVMATSPRLVTLAEQEVDDNAARFQKRFVETLQYYAFVLDSLGPDDGAAILAVERALLAPDIANAVSVDGRRRTERHERLVQWKGRMGGAGFELVPMSEAARMQAEYLIRRAPNGRNFEVVKDEAGGLLLGWQGKPLVAVSAWTPASASASAAPASADDGANIC